MYAEREKFPPLPQNNPVNKKPWDSPVKQALQPNSEKKALLNQGLNQNSTAKSNLPVWIERIPNGDFTFYKLHLRINLTYDKDVPETYMALNEYWKTRESLTTTIKQMASAAFTSSFFDDPDFSENKIAFITSPDDVVIDSNSPIEMRIVRTIPEKTDGLGHTASPGNISQNLLRIKLNDNPHIAAITKPQQFNRTIAHELGHMMGLHHPKEDVENFPGYSTGEERVRAAGPMNLMNQTGDINIFSEVEKQAAAQRATGLTAEETPAAFSLDNAVRLNYSQFYTILRTIASAGAVDPDH